MNRTSQATSLDPSIGHHYRFSSVGLLPKHPSLIFLFIISGDNDAILRLVPCPLASLTIMPHSAPTTADRSYVLFLKPVKNLGTHAAGKAS